MKNSLKLSLWLLLAAVVVPMPTTIVAVAKSKAEKDREFKGFIRQYKDAKALFNKRKKEGAPRSELAGYRKQMRQARRRALALYGAIAFAAAAAATVAYFKLKEQGKDKEALEVGKGKPGYKEALEGDGEEAPAKKEPQTPPQEQKDTPTTEDLRMKINYLINDLKLRINVWQNTLSDRYLPDDLLDNQDKTVKVRLQNQFELLKTMAGNITHRLNALRTTLTNQTASSIKTEMNTQINRDLDRFGNIYNDLIKEREKLRAKVKEIQRAPMKEGFQELPFAKK